MIKTFSTEIAFISSGRKYRIKQLFKAVCPQYINKLPKTGLDSKEKYKFLFFPEIISFGASV